MTMADGLSGELFHYLLDALYCVPAPERRQSSWVMTAEWFDDVRKINGPDHKPLWEPSFMVTGPELLLGLPIVIREDGGAPHLEQLQDADHGRA